MKHALIGDQGAIDGFFDSEAHPVLPDGAVPLTEEQYAVWVADSAGYRWDGLGLAEAPARPLPEVRQVRAAGLGIDCARHLLGGFVSAALGAEATYGSNEVDQRNLTSTATLAVAPGLAADWSTPLWCADAAGTWSLRDHDAAQVQAVALDWHAARVAAQRRLGELRAAVEAAGTADAIEAVTW